MKSYELVLIFRPDVDMPVIEGVIEKVREVIQSHTGTVSGVDDWGRREMTFVLQKVKQGHYFNVRFTTEDGSVVDGLNRVLRISEPVMKFQTHRVSETERGFKGNPLVLKGSSEESVQA